MGMWKMPMVYVLQGHPLCDMSSVGFVLCRIPNFPRLLVITTGGKTFNLPLSPCKCVLRCVCLWFLYILFNVEQRLLYMLKCVLLFKNALNVAFIDDVCVCGHWTTRSMNCSSKCDIRISVLNQLLSCQLMHALIL